MIKVEAVVIRERVETVIDAVEMETGHVGVTVVEAIGHGRQRGVTHEYRGRVFESRFLPKAVLTFIVEDSIAEAVADAIADSARSGNESGDGIVWTSPVNDVTHNRTGKKLEEVEVNQPPYPGARFRPDHKFLAGSRTFLTEVQLEPLPEARWTPKHAHYIRYYEELGKNKTSATK